LAMEACRRKGRVIIVGDIRILVKREHFYKKEIDLKISCSYGPGRYDHEYEEKGHDYPFGYVRWTEGRNMAEYLRLLKEKKVDLSPLELKKFPVEEAETAYESLKASAFKPFGAYIQYRKEEDEKKRKSRFKTTIEIPVLSSVKVKKGRKVKIALVGIGNFARSFHLPNLKELKDLYQIYAVVDSNGALGREIANLEKVPKASTSMDDLLSDPELDAVLIATRHNTHADLTLKAIKAGKAVFVEKPMAMSREEVENIVSMLEKNPVQYMVGFNRRFSPTAVRAKEILKKRKAPVIILYRVMAGYLPPEHWTQGEEGGGRLVGEACHMFDLFNYLVGSCDVTDVQVMAVPPGDSGIIHPDNVSVNISYGDGSLCTLLYLASGGKNLPKEYLEVHCENQTLVLDNFRSLKVIGGSGKGISGKSIRKGHREELIEFARYVREEIPAPITLEEIVTATEVSFQADELSREI
ncbi:MAG: Gfo/Idh/MocA family oxidoreductase, partial [Candidatus Eremiobacteraeota bacterium]|nr:Gfo/Idh/MocA family oxidoreductase [Candidatus Eremiobacteraeota bacterium]